MKKSAIILFLLVAVTFGSFASGGMFAYNHFDGFSFHVSTGYEYKVLNAKTVPTKITAPSIPVNFYLMYLFPSEENFGFLLGTSLKFPMRYKNSFMGKTFDYKESTVIVNPYLLFVYNTSNWNEYLTFTGGLGLKYDKSAYYLEDLIGDIEHITSVEFEALAMLRFALSERYRFIIGARGGYSILNWRANNFFGIKEANSYSVSPFIGVNYEF